MLEMLIYYEDVCLIALMSDYLFVVVVVSSITAVLLRMTQWTLASAAQQNHKMAGLHQI